MRAGWLERTAVAVCSLALAGFLIAALSGYFTARDRSAVSGATEVGLQFPDQGDELLAPGSRHPRYVSDPPTSGPHVPVAVGHNATVLSDDQILQALSAGDVVLVYGTRRPPAGLRRVAARLAGPFTPALAAAGQAVVLARRPGARGLQALAWTRLLRVSGPGDPLLRQFVELYLGERHAARLRGG